MSGKTIVWMSRHAPLASQLKELERLFPKHKLIVEKRPFTSVAQILKRFRDVGGDEMVTVAPWSVIRELIKLGIRPIYAEMVQVNTKKGEKASDWYDQPDPDTTIITGRSKKKRYYKFLRFSYCTDVSLTLVPIEPPLNVKGNQTVLLNPDGSTKSIIK
jgi:hypothetical protein